MVFTFEMNSPSIISILLNTQCNLQCKHCYLESFQEKEWLSSKEWEKVFVSLFFDLNPQTVVFAGKEIFVNAESVQILSRACELRDHLQKNFSRRTKIGVITNGTLVHYYRDVLENISLDWIDISIDGTREQHNLIRGKGAYEQMERNLPWLKERFGKNLWVVPVLCNENAEQLPFLIKELHEKYGLSHYSLGLYEHRFSAEDNFSVDVSHLALFLEKLKEISFASPINLVLKLGLRDKRFSDFFNLPSDKKVITEARRTLGNNVFLEIYKENFPIGYWRSVRISPSGYWVAAEDSLDHQNYTKNAVVNLRDVNYDVRKAYEMGLHSKKTFHGGFKLRVL